MKIVHFIIVLLIFLIPFFFLSNEVFSQNPSLIHLSTEGDPSNSITISWKTRINTDTSSVQYGITNEYGETSFGKSFIYHIASEMLHQVKIENLSPDTLYHYRVGDNIAGWSKDLTFRTAPVKSKNFTFTVYGDQGTSKISKQNVAQISKIKPVFHIHTGDLSYSNGFPSVWDYWFDLIEPISSYSLYFPTIGNHEFEGGLSLYLEQFALPNNERWYSFNWGNTHFVSIEINSELIDDGDQYEWLIDDLSKTSKDNDINWIIVFFHYPPYSSGEKNPGIVNLRSDLLPILELYNVDLVLNGHDHIYQRTFPLKNSTVTSTDEDKYVDPTGIIYVVTGGGGKSLYDLVNPEPYWSAYRESIYHFLSISINGNYLHLKAIKTGDGSIIDDFQIIKSN